MCCAIPAGSRWRPEGPAVSSDRLTAFSDGVIAVIITIMVLELKAPAGLALSDLAALWPVFSSYALSFVYVGIYWNNHHHLYQLVEEVSGTVLWANLNLLFWLSLVPFTTAWLGAHPGAATPTAVYGASLLMPALAWWGMDAAIARVGRQKDRLREAFGGGWKPLVSPPMYLAGIALAYVAPILSYALYAGVALLWFIPSRRVEDLLRRHD